ncbi:MAG: hypothetical protein AAF235_06590 [Planctomycetota bacterium]
MGTREILLATIVPGFAAAVIGLIGWWLLARKQQLNASGGDHGATSMELPIGARIIGPLVIAAATLLGAYAWQTSLEIWPRSATQRFPVIALAAGAAGLLAALVPSGLRIVTSSVFGGAAGAFGAWVFLGVLQEPIITDAERLQWVGYIGFRVAVLAAVLEVALRVLPGVRGPLAIWAVVGTIALGLTQGWANAPLVLGPVAWATLGLGLLGVLVGPRNVLAGSGTTIAVMLGSAATFSNWFGDTERWPMLVVLLDAPLLLGVAALPWFASRAAWIRLLVAVAAPLLLAGVQAGIAVPGLIAATTASDDDAYDYGY